MTSTGTRLGYSRLLALLFGHLPTTSREYPADSGRWSDAILRLRDKYEEQYPGLFEALTFSKKPGRLPYSREVSKFLMRLQAGTVVQVMNPGFARLMIRPEAQKEMLSHHASKVDAETLAIIKDLASELERDKALVIPESSST